MSLLKDKRFFALLVLLIAACLFFWLSSRYPALDAKAMMAGNLAMDDGLSFDAWLPHAEQPSWWQTTVVTFLNWLHTNRQGMAFGLVVALLVMSMLPLIRNVITARLQGISASVLGLVFGAPLGVCVNCAAPIAFGMYQRGARAETTVAAMLSSPTLNVIIVSMLISFFAWPIVLVKLLSTILAILIIVPLLVRLFPREAYAVNIDADFDHSERASRQQRQIVQDEKQHWALWLVDTLLANARYLVSKVIPLMLAAGLIGSLLITVLPWEFLLDQLRVWDRQGQVFIVILLVALAIFGLLLPVPMAFDVIICITLMNAGVPIKYVAVLLFSLGIFSVYSYMVLWQAGAKKIATALLASLFILSLLAGLSSHFAMLWYEKRNELKLYASLQNDSIPVDSVAIPKPSQPGTFSDAPVLAYVPSSDFSATSSISSEQAVIAAVDVLKLREQTSFSTDKMMAKVTNSGFQLHPVPLLDRLETPIMHMGALAAGDINNDHWTDVVVATSVGAYVYMNTGNGFELVDTAIQQELSHPTSTIALIDINNDGWLDLFFSQLNRGSYVSFSDKGQFSFPKRLDTHQSLATFAFAFGDVNHDGLLDIVHGNYGASHWHPISPSNAKNQLLIQNELGDFEVEQLTGIAAETLTALLSDLNGDSWLDLLVGNDFDEPDTYYRGGSDGFQQWPTDALITTETTMSIDSADIDNDLSLETFHVQITRNSASPPFKVPQLSLADYINTFCKNPVDVEYQHSCNALRPHRHIARSTDPNACFKISNASQQKDCLAGFWFRTQGVYSRHAKPEKVLAKAYPELAQRLFNLRQMPLRQDEPQGFKQQRGQNFLYSYDGDQIKPKDITERAGVSLGGWGWNGKFADLDGDQWQDLYLVNGWDMDNLLTSNIWFKNDQGQSFDNKALAAGLEDYIATFSSLYIDYDNDGDLDLLSFNSAGELKLYNNQNIDGNRHIQFELRDFVGNHDGIGSHLVIFYGNGKSQLRELKASGGYLSHDDLIFHFGLGQFDQVDRVEVVWSTGQKWHFSGNFIAGKRYRLSRYGNLAKE